MPFRASVDRRRRYREARRQDGRHRAICARLLARDRDVVVVAMGRGGPPEPEKVTVRPTVEALVELSRSGRHAASDHLETAAVVGVDDDRVQALRRRARWSGRDVERRSRAPRSRQHSFPTSSYSTGAALRCPPVAADRTVVVVGGHQDPAVVGRLPERLPPATRRPRRGDDGRGLRQRGRRCGRASREIVRDGVAGGRDDAPTARARGRPRPVGRLLLHGSRERARSAPARTGSEQRR